MRVFMLGWEFPPFISGGLGTACYGLTKAMSSIGTDVMFVLPRPVTTPFSTHVRLVSPRPGSALASPSTEFRLDEFEHVTFRTVNAQLSPYAKAEDYQKEIEEKQRTAAAVGDVATAKAAAAASIPAAGGAPTGANYAGDLISETQRYAMLAAEIARNESFDVVHAHDWMTFP